MLIMGHPTANSNVRHALRALHGAGLVGEFHTGVDTSRLADRAPKRMRAELARRSFDPQLHHVIRTHPWGEWARLALERSHRLNLRSQVPRRVSIDGRYEVIDRALAHGLDSGAFSGVYGYEDGAAGAFARAADLELSRVYDLPIGYWRAARRILGEESELRPQWASTMPGLRDTAAKLERKDTELALATQVVVASSFTHATLADADFPLTTNVVTIPYGTPRPAEEYKARPADGPLRVLYVGSLSQRKGIADLFEAMEHLGSRASLTVVGRAPDPHNAALVHAMAQVRWIPSLAPAGILDFMRGSDVVVLPSLFEGFGLVLTEALSQGTPIIATSHTAAPDLLARAQGDIPAGWIVPIRSPENIASCLENLASDRALLMAASRSATDLARTLSWGSYESSLVKAVTEGLT